jgi:hypothetical protein
LNDWKPGFAPKSSFVPYKEGNPVGHGRFSRIGKGDEYIG